MKPEILYEDKEIIVVDYKTDMTLSKVWSLVPATWTKL